MKFTATTTATAALFAGLVAAAPGAQGQGVKYVQLTYEAAADNNYVIYVPINGGSVAVGSDLSFSHIVSSDPTGSASCYSTGVDEDPNGNIVVTVTQGSETVDIGPPQVQTEVYCTGSW
ncbi:unnamed protein product [Discula destructiva]